MKHFYDKKFEDLLHQSRLPFTQDKKAAWQAIQDRIAKQGETPVYKIKRFWAPVRVAAAIVAFILAGAIAVILSGEVASDGNSEEITEVFLPDGSEVTLNGIGQVTYNKWLWTFDRSVSLEGEAFFDVIEGSKFTVEVEQGEVQVLGTSFSVLSRGDQFTVACKTGKVRVYHDSGAAIDLDPGDLAVEEGNVLVERAISTEAIGVWAGGELFFESVSASELFNELEKVTEYHFVIKANLDMTYSGQFNISQPIEDILNIVCLPMNLDYKVSGKEVIITNK